MNTAFYYRPHGILWYTDAAAVLNRSPIQWLDNGARQSRKHSMRAGVGYLPTVILGSQGYEFLPLHALAPTRGTGGNRVSFAMLARDGQRRKTRCKVGSRLHIVKVLI